MSGPFKDAIAQDLSRVFINPAEFGEQHDINGETVTAVIDSDILKERQSRARGEYAEGVYEDRRVVFVRAADVSPKPVRGALLRLDGERFLVEEVTEDFGLLEITILANET